MFKSVNKRFMLLVILTAVYNFVFWHEKAGLNLAVFVVLCSIAVIIVNLTSASEQVSNNKKLIVLLLAVVYSAAMVVAINSAFSIFALVISIIVFTGFAQQRAMKSIYGAILTTISSMILFPFNALEGIRRSRRYKVFSFFLKTLKVVLIPVIIVMVFYSLYAYANPMFNTYSESFWTEIGKYLNKVFYDYPFLRFLFIFSGLFLITGLLYNNNIHLFADLDNTFLEKFYRNRDLKLVWKTNPERYIPFVKRTHLFNPKMKSFLTEYRIGLVLLIMVNLLIAFLNVLDINFVWLNFNSKEVGNLAYYVHEGTYVLIFSILLSMCILLYLFRGNANFFSKGILLKVLAYFWIFQNAIMAISVGLRNYYYIEYYYALSYKRIGVVIFLALTLIGLVTMILKIYQKRTTYNIFKINAAAAFIVLIVISSFNWDIAIADFNLSNPDKKSIDARYLLSLSDNVLPSLDRNKDVLELHNDDFSFSRMDYEETEVFNQRKRSFLKDYENYSWLSLNYPDWKTYNYFTKKEN